MYASINEWLNEQEGYGVRAERVPAVAMPWIREAARVERERLEAEIERLRTVLRDEAAWLKENRFFDRAKRISELSN